MRKIFITFLIITSTFLYFSCKRESLNSELISPKILKAQNWFENYLTTFSTNLVFKNIHYHWDKAKEFTFKNGYVAITIPITEINQNPNYTGQRILYLYPWKNGKGYYTTVFEILPDKSHLVNNLGKINLKKFDGIICAWDLKIGFTKGIKYQSSNAVSNINLEIKKLSGQISNVTLNGSNLPPVTVYSYISSANWNMFWISLMNSLGYNTSNLWGSGGGNPCEYSGCGGSENPDDFIDPNSFTEPNNNDDNDGKAETKDVTDNIDDTCIKATFDKITSLNMRNNISDILHNTFGGSKDFNIHFHDDPLGDVMKDGNTVPVIWPSGRMDFDITLNSEVLPNSSREFTAATIYHEILHAYLRTTGLIGNLNHHNSMANDFATKLANALQNAFPGLDPLDAKGLAWGGLDGSAAYDSIRVNHPSELLDLQSRNAQHRVNSKGTPCN